MNKKNKKKRSKKRRKKKVDEKKKLSKKLKKGARETIGPVPPTKKFKDMSKYDRKKEKRIEENDS
ncbi:hypothetical protein KAI78_05625 [bacterium]|nr:hypothetical protein [bacterium]